jgi:hypothetical protein
MTRQRPSEAAGGGSRPHDPFITRSVTGDPWGGGAPRADGVAEERRELPVELIVFRGIPSLKVERLPCQLIRVRSAILCLCRPASCRRLAPWPRALTRPDHETRESRVRRNGTAL